MFIETMDGSIVDLIVDDAPEGMTDKERWIQLTSWVNSRILMYETERTSSGDKYLWSVERLIAMKEVISKMEELGDK
jgi:hypothetical protein